MRETSESQNRSLRNRPTYENTKEVLELVRSQDVNANVLFDEVLLKRASNPRPNEPLPSIRVGGATADKETAEESGEIEIDNGGKYLLKLSGGECVLEETRDRSPRTSPATSGSNRHRCASTTSCPERLCQPEEKTGSKIRWRSSSDAPLLETRNRSPRNSTSTSRARRLSLRTNLPPLEMHKQRLERPKSPVGGPRRSRKESLKSSDRVDQDAH